jgi:hypothetical protein
MGRDLKSGLGASKAGRLGYCRMQKKLPVTFMGWPKVWHMVLIIVLLILCYLAVFLLRDFLFSPKSGDPTYATLKRSIVGSLVEMEKGGQWLLQNDGVCERPLRRRYSYELMKKTGSHYKAIEENNASDKIVFIDCVLPDFSGPIWCNYFLFFECRSYLIHSFSINRKIVLDNLFSYLENPCRIPINLQEILNIDSKYGISKIDYRISSTMHSYNRCKNFKLENSIVILIVINDDGDVIKTIKPELSFPLEIAWSIFDRIFLPIKKTEGSSK